MNMNSRFFPRLCRGFALLAVLLAGCSDSSSPAKDEPAQAAPQSSAPAVKPLSPMFAAAMTCLDSCVQVAYGREDEDLPTKLPRKFKDFLIGDEAAAKTFNALVNQFPAAYWPLATKGAAERENMEMEGWTGYIIKSGDDLIHIYVQAGFPQREWTPGPNRRPPGSLTVGVSTKTKAMAIVFNGQEDLSEYRFAGNEALLSVVTAYMGAHEAETERAFLISRTQQSDPTVFPVPAAKKDDVVRRLTYLNGLIENGQIFNARSAYSAGDDARRTPPEKQWWSADSGFTHCFETGGPAAKLDEFVGFTDKPTTKDYRDGSGNLYKVEVINYEGRGQERVWTYYRTQAKCEAEQVNATRSLADKYR